MSDPKAEYGWHFVADDDLRTGDEHWADNEWFMCGSANPSWFSTTTPICQCKFRRRKIVAPEGMRIMDTGEQAPRGEVHYTTDGSLWRVMDNHVEETVSSCITRPIGQNLMQILAIATPVKKSVLDACNEYAAAIQTLKSKTSNLIRFQFGDQVRKVGGDYTFDGTVVSVFNKLSGKTRYVVEDDRGCLHIYSDKNLEAYGK